MVDILKILLKGAAQRRKRHGTLRQKLFWHFRGRRPLALYRFSRAIRHSMRTFEVPAIGACIVVEDTLEHRLIFGEDGARVLYFKTAREMVEQVRMLLANEILRRSLRDNVHVHDTGGANTYSDRFASMINTL
jgi:hypothetical protein